MVCGAASGVGWGGCARLQCDVGEPANEKRDGSVFSISKKGGSFRTITVLFLFYSVM